MQAKTPKPSISPRKRPLYRQSSMEFMDAPASDLKDNDTINKWVIVRNVARRGN